MHIYCGFVLLNFMLILVQAYRQRPSSSVQIARIAALTVVAASFILGAFILASSYVAARASCHQLEQLDAMLDKELALEGRTYGNNVLLDVSTSLFIKTYFVSTEPFLQSLSYRYTRL